MSWQMEHLVAVGLAAGLAALLWLWFARAAHRTRRGLAAARERHHRALVAVQQQLGPGVCDLQPGGDDDPWAALEGEQHGVELRLGVGALLGRTTFIRYGTHLTVRPRGGVRCDKRVELRLGAPEQIPPALAALDLPRELALELTVLTALVVIEPGQIVLTARPGGDTTRRYSYAYELLVLPAALARLWQLGPRLGRHLQRPAGP